MESADDKHWAQKTLIDPLNEPEPYAEDGPGNTFAAPASVARSASNSKKLQKNPFRSSSTSSKNPFVTENEVSRKSSNRAHPPSAYPSPPQSASPQKSTFSPERDTFGNIADAAPAPPPKDKTQTTGRPRRASSLKARFAGDTSHLPLETLTHRKRQEDRAQHLRKKHQILPDTIDRLDVAGGSYHHEGPFDATYAARNTSYLNAPIEAVAATNEETLKATPRERIVDAVERHRPLDGVAAYAPGQVDDNGHMYDYEQGENMMIEGNPAGGAYKRWPGVQYHPDDIKGKGEPSYTIEKQLKEHQEGSRFDSGNGIEMSSRPRSTSHADRTSMGTVYGDNNGDVKRSNTTGKHSGTIRRRFGSIRKSLGGNAEA